MVYCSAHQLQLDDLQNILSSMNIPPVSSQGLLFMVIANPEIFSLGK